MYLVYFRSSTLSSKQAWQNRSHFITFTLHHVNMAAATLNIEYLATTLLYPVYYLGLHRKFDEETAAE